MLVLIRESSLQSMRCLLCPMNVCAFCRISVCLNHVSGSQPHLRHSTRPQPQLTPRVIAGLDLDTVEVEVRNHIPWLGVGRMAFTVDGKCSLRHVKVGVFVC